MRFFSLLPAFISLGALITGAGMILSPNGSLLGFPLEMLRGSPFKTFLLPGVILFTVNGLGQAAVAWLTLRRHALSGTAMQVAGLSLAIWIFVQVSMIGGGHWLQNAYFVFALLEIISGWVLLTRGRSR
ncbi:MAG: hypothetical protein J0L75_03810 [Spirochaetes bacterium]|nr:hypothetical protein [Spirochaetota bacterium]